MDMPKEFCDMVCADIKRMDKARELDAARRLQLHRKIDGRYRCC